MTDTSFERIVLSNDRLRVEILPRFGGKISSILTQPDGHELLQQPLRPYPARTAAMSFDQGEASGWDECLPSVAACVIDTPSGATTIPDHGDFWRVAATAIQHANQVKLESDGLSLPLHFSRTVHLDGPRLTVDYRVLNTGDIAVPYAWSVHPLFAVEAGDRIVLPPTVGNFVVEGSGHNRLGLAGTTHDWPHVTLRDGKSADLSIAGHISDDIGDKIFIAAPPEGWCAIDRERLGLRVTMRFDPKSLPWLGLWLCYGGWPDGPSEKQFAVAPEPCTAPVDSLATAIDKGWARTLAPQASSTWSLEVEFAAKPI